MTIPGPHDPDYGDWHATVANAIRLDVDGAGGPTPGAWESLVRLGKPRPEGLVDLDPFDLSELEATVEASVDRGRRGELSTDDAAHEALAGLRERGVPVPPRPPADPFPDL